MIITKITGGLGNQLFQYSLGKAVADYHKVPLKLDISAYKAYTLHKGYRLDQFKISAAIATKNDIKRLKGSETLTSRILRKAGLVKNKSYFTEKQRTIYDEEVFDLATRYLDGYWQNQQYFLSIRKIIIQEFQTKEPLSDKAYNYQDQITKSNAVSLHIRRGDYLKHPEIGVLDVSYYKHAVEYIKNRIEAPRFFIFSNDFGWCQENLDFIDNPIYVENTETEIDDLVLMSNCGHNIIANSSFSWWGAWLNGSENKVVISPRKWMAVNPKNHKWVPHEWLQL